MTVDAILVIVNLFLKYTIYLLTQKALLVKNLVKLFVENLVQWIIFLQHIILNWDKLFTSKFW